MMRPRPRTERPPKHIVRFQCGKYYARTIRREDASDRWASWLADPWAMYTLNSPPQNLYEADMANYIKQFDHRSRVLLGVFERGTRMHIGIVRLDINYATSECLVSLLIGEPEFRNKGVQANVFTATLDHLFDKVGIKKLKAWVLERNEVSMRYLPKAGWTMEKTPWQEIKSTADGTMLGVRSFSLTPDAWRAWKQTPLGRRIVRRVHNAGAG